MSSRDGSDDKEPVEHDRFEEELARLLSDEWRFAFEENDDGGFDTADFVTGLYSVEGVFFLPAAVQVPLAAFLEAQRADALHQLELVVDKHGQTYLVGIAGSEGDQVMLASVLLKAVDNEDDS